ncbi:MAG: ABC transporter ATP-binding protein [Acidobacteriota bacterium]|nr:ABC transporter ATP-binding protein [Acidobacteriota bacterium]
MSRSFGALEAVRGMDLKVEPGELFCFLGPNGAGKTTTIKMIVGLLRPTSGQALVGGHDLQREPLAARRLLGYVPDRPLLYEKLTGRELMRFVAGLYRMPQRGLDDAIDELLERFEIAAAADRLVETYSQGMRQKISFAVTFLHQPQVVVVDEPWVGLDPRSMRRLREELQRRTREGLTVFMSTHTLSLAEQVADRIGIIHRGRLRHLGSVAEIKALARHPGSLEDVFLSLTQEGGQEESPGEAPEGVQGPMPGEDRR